MMEWWFCSHRFAENKKEGLKKDLSKQFFGDFGIFQRNLLTETLNNNFKFNNINFSIKGGFYQTYSPIIVLLESLLTVGNKYYTCRCNLDVFF